MTPEKVRWGEYGSYEGPWTPGGIRFTVGENPDDVDRYLAVVSAVEGCYDAVNMYDRGIVSVGVIQWIEAGQYSVSQLLGAVAARLGTAYIEQHLGPALKLVGATFKKNARGQWRFHFNDAQGEVDTLEKTRQLFLGCSGLKGDWTPDAKVRARLWCSCISNVWQTEPARRVQREFTRARLMGFAMKDAKEILFDGTANEGWTAALRAAFISFAVNRPVAANAQVKLAAQELRSQKWSPDWCTGVLKALTFGPKISIYPERYEKVRPVLEKIWGISLPKTAAMLEKWQEPVPTPEPAPEPPPGSPGGPPDVPEDSSIVQPPEQPKEAPGPSQEPPSGPIEIVGDRRWPWTNQLELFMRLVRFVVGFIKNVLVKR